jgi:hypothetical protein
VLLLLALSLAAAAPPVDWVVGAGGLYTPAEGTDVPIRGGGHVAVRARAIAEQGWLRAGGELDERTTRILASRKSALVGLGRRSERVGASLLSGVGLVERGLFGPWARWDLHVPAEVVLDAHGPVHVQLRAKAWVGVAARPHDGRWGPWGGEGSLAIAPEIRGDLRPRFEAGWREEFGQDVFLVVFGAGT